MAPRMHHLTSPLGRLTLSFALAAAVFVFGFAVDHSFAHYETVPLASWLDEIVSASVAGLLVFLYARQRDRVLAEKLKVIDLMNHHVRNALQVIVNAQFHMSREQVEVIDTAVKRIDWALRKILPGDGVEPLAKEAEGAYASGHLWAIRRSGDLQFAGGQVIGNRVMGNLMIQGHPLGLPASAAR